MYIDIFNHTNTLILIWQLILASSIGHYQAIIQECECVQKLSTIR